MAREVYTARAGGHQRGWCARSGSPPATPATRTCTSTRWRDKVYRHPRSTNCPTQNREPHVRGACDRRAGSASPIAAQPDRAHPPDLLLRAALGRHLPDPRPAPGRWCGHGPGAGEDIALTNLALDLIGSRRRALLPMPAGWKGKGFDEDQLAFPARRGRRSSTDAAEQPMRGSQRTHRAATLPTPWCATCCCPPG